MCGDVRNKPEMLHREAGEWIGKSSDTAGSGELVQKLCLKTAEEDSGSRLATVEENGFREMLSKVFKLCRECHSQQIGILESLRLVTE